MIVDLGGFHIYAFGLPVRGPFPTREAAEQYEASPEFQNFLRRLRLDREDDDARVVYAAGGGGSVSTPAPPPPGPETISGLILWVKASDLSQADGSYVNNLTDASGTGNNLNSTPNPNTAKFYNNQINGRPAIHYWYSGQPLYHVMTSAWKPSTPTSGECFCVCRSQADPTTDPAHGGIWSAGTAGVADHIPYQDGTVYLGWGRTTRPNIGNLAPDFSQWHRLNIWSATNDYSFQVDGATVYSTASSTPGFATTPSLGGNITVTYAGYIAEYIQYNRKLTAPERASVNTYLTWRYGI